MKLTKLERITVASVGIALLLAALWIGPYVISLVPAWHWSVTPTALTSLLIGVAGTLLIIAGIKGDVTL